MKTPSHDWDRPPKNRWSFLNIKEILPTAPVARGQGPARALAAAPRDLDGLPVSAVDGRPASLADLLTETYADGFLVLHKGQVAYERYFNGMTAATLHLSQSVAKSFTGAMVGMMIAKGLMRPEAPVTDYLPELEATGWKGATLQQVLDMTTGVKFSETYTDPFSDIGRVDVASGWKPLPDGAEPGPQWPNNMWELALTLKHTVRPHGAAFQYRSIETDVLAFCLQRVTGKPLPQLLSEMIWQPAGMEADALYTVDPSGFAIADGGLNACLRDYGRFGQLVLEGGGGIIPPSWITATRNGDHSKSIAAQHPEMASGAYHNQFWIEDPEHKSLLALGVFGQLIYVSWRYDMVIVKLSTWPDFLNQSFSRATLAACHAIGRHLQG